MKTKLIILTFSIIISNTYTFGQNPTSVASGLNWIITGGVTSGAPASPSYIKAIGATGQGGGIVFQTGNAYSAGGDVYLLLGTGSSYAGRFLLGTSTSSTPLTISGTGNVATTGSVSAGSFTTTGSVSAGSFSTSGYISAGSFSTNGSVSAGSLFLGGNTLTIGSGTAGSIVNLNVNGQGGLKTFAKFDYNSQSINFNYPLTVSGNISASGLVSIGTSTIRSGCTLTVAGKIAAQEFEVVSNVNVPDYVFGKNYQLRPLSDLENYIHANSHLPEVPSAKEIEANGYKVAEMDNLLLKKIEELTLYTLELNKQLEDTKAELEKMKNGGK